MFKCNVGVTILYGTRALNCTYIEQDDITLC